MAQNIVVQLVIQGKNLAGSVLGAVRSQVDDLKKSVSSLQSQLAGLGASLTLGAVSKYLVSVNTEYGNLVARLTTVTESASKAKAVFADLNALAAKTPFSAGKWAEAYITLKNNGITPTLDTLKAFGNIAAVSGQSVETLSESIRNAALGNMRSLRQFGIGMTADGDNLVATFRGQKEKIGRDAQDIVDYLQRIGSTKLAGGMDREAQTLGGSFKRLQNATESLARSIGDAGLSKDLSNAANSLDKMVTSANNVDEIAVRYRAFTGILGTLVDALTIVAQAMVLPVVAVADTVSAIIHGVVGTVVGGLSVIGSAVDTFSGGKLHFGQSMRDFAKGQFGAAGDDFKGIFGAGKTLADDIGSAIKNANDREAELIKLAARAQLNAANPTAATSVLGTGGATASTEDLNKDHSAKDAKAARKQYLDDLTARVGVLKEYVALNENAAQSANELAHLETVLAQAVARGNFSDEDRLRLLHAQKEARDARRGAGFFTVDELEGQTAKRELEFGIEQTAKGMVAAQVRATGKEGFDIGERAVRDIQGLPQIGGTVDANGVRHNGTFLPPGTNVQLAEVADGLRRAAGEGQKLNDVIGHIGVATFDAFGNAVEQAFAAMVTGSQSGAKAFESAMLGALASVAAGFGQFFLTRATGEVAAGVGALSNPITAPEAAGHFLSAGEWTAGAFAMFALAGSLKGASSNVGGAGSRGASSAASSNSALSNSQGDATLVVEGGFLDMNDPKQADALANALAALSGRRVKITKR